MTIAEQNGLLDFFDHDARPYRSARCSAMGPSTATGMNMSRPRMTITAHRVNPNVPAVRAQ